MSRKNFLVIVKRTRTDKKNPRREKICSRQMLLQKIFSF